MSRLITNAGDALVTNAGDHLVDQDVNVSPDGVVNATGIARTPAASVTGPVGTAATGTGAAYNYTVAIGTSPAAVTGTGVANAVTVTVSVNAGVATGTGVAQQASAQGISAPNVDVNPDVAPGTGTANAPTVTVSPTPTVVTGVGAAQDATTTGVVPVFPGVATGTGLVVQSRITVGQSAGRADAFGAIRDANAVGDFIFAYADVATGVGVVLPTATSTFQITMVWRFTPPTEPSVSTIAFDCPPQWNRLRRHYTPAPRGRAVFKLPDQTYTFDQPYPWVEKELVTQGAMFPDPTISPGGMVLSSDSNLRTQTLDRVYYGGHVYVVSVEEKTSIATFLDNSGYTSTDWLTFGPLDPNEQPPVIVPPPPPISVFVTAYADVAAGVGQAYNASIPNIQVFAQTATGIGQAVDATAQTDVFTIASAGVATGAGVADTATETGAAFQPATTATGTGTANNPSITLGVGPGAYGLGYPDGYA